ncbi:MAG: pilus assembly FimT family protein [Betaproteobacteria bacterium]
MGGLTLIELVIYMAIAAVLGAVALFSYTPDGTKARYQAERVRTDLRYVQMLALTQGTPMRLTATAGAGGSYAVTTIGGVGSGACTTSALTDPATGSTFLVTLDSALTLGGTGTLDLDSLGRPASCAGNPCSCAVITSGTDPAASYTVAGGGTTYTVAVRPTTGFATLTP